MTKSRRYWTAWSRKMADRNKKSPSNQGIVYLIGAGPGDPGLFTVKGREILNQCHAVVYDNLIPDELIVLLPEKVEKYFVGKSAGKHTLKQEDINRLLVKLALEGKKIARLKGGDPFLFGRGGEEARYLQENNIRFEIIPGITAGTAAPAYCGIPCTDREQSSFVLFVTGHKAIEKKLSSVPWEWVAQAKSGTLVIYMGVGELPNIARKLIEGGMPADIESCIIERGTFPSQRAVSATLSELPEKAQMENIKPPAIIMIGEVVSNEPLLNWHKQKPLYGLRIMVTRPADQAEPLYGSLRDLGAEVLPCPTIATSEYMDITSWEKFENLVKDDSKNKWVVFTGENGVRYFLNPYISRYGDIRKLSRFRLAAVGIGTVEALGGYNLKPDFIPAKATIDSFVKEFKSKVDLTESTIIRVKGSLADNRIEEGLEPIAREILPIEVYKTYVPQWPGNMRERLFKYPPDLIVFTSASTVDGFVKVLNSGEIKKLIRSAKILSMGPSATRALKSSGLAVSYEADEHTIPGIIKCLKKLFGTPLKEKKSLMPKRQTS
ncbi:MAG: uroporphyrinogen-III C-methyltransferase [Candidatus Zixiibacteriota bacterium]|nr:MAG: uroporphyrinogen-III C-methyltransferase [candidate division Zixibacteria bacterium]